MASMNEYLCDGERCVTRYVTVVMPKYEPCEERELFEDMGYEYKGASECYSDSIYFFEYRYREGMTSVQARSRQEALAIYMMARN